jgi:hypothetical protein
MNGKRELRRLRRLGRLRVEQFQRVVEINAALDDGNWLELTELLDIDFALVASMNLDEWQQTVIVRLHDYATAIGIQYKWNDTESEK